MTIFVYLKYIFSFTIKYIKYIYYGLKQRLRAMFKLELGVFDFFKSLFNLPFESWHYTKMELSHG